MLAALKHLNFPIEPSIPNDVLHNSSAEAGIRIVRQGTRTLLLQSGLPISAWPRAMQTFAFQYDCTTAPNLERGGIRELSHQMVQELTSEGVGVVDSADAPAGADEDAVGGNLPTWESKLHLALTYQPEIRMVPFGACVWYRDPTRPKSFKPNGIPAVYVGPEVLPGLRCKDVHILYDLAELTGSGRFKTIIAKDFVLPTGKWLFPLTHVPMLKPITPDLSQPPAPDDVEDEDPTAGPRNRSITKRRIIHYGPTEFCDGCLRGTYSHSLDCRGRFNKLLNESEPLAEQPGGGTVDGDGNCEGRDIEIDSDQQLGEQIMFDIRDELRNLLEEDLVPVYPPRSDVSESSGPAPTTPLDDNDDDDVVSVLSSAESGFIDDMDEIGELQPVPGGWPSQKVSERT